MTSASLQLLAPRPDSEFEWEDLLVKLELMPRALRIALEDVDREATGVAAVVTSLVERERVAAELLESAAAAPALPDQHTQVVSVHGDALDRFVRLRTRNFAMVQRRGLEVWDWEVRLDDGSTATVHQLLGLLVREDVSALAAIRRLLVSDAGMC